MSGRTLVGSCGGGAGGRADAAWVQELRLQPVGPDGRGGGGGGGGGPDTSGALMFIGLAAACIVGLAFCCAVCVCVRRRCSRLGEKDSIDSEPDFWTSNVRT